MLKKLCFFFSVCLLINQTMAGVTGKIAGKVYDVENATPLPGVNVVIEGTSMGAAADVNGNYVILNVPVGTYRLKASMIGYTAVVITHVQVSIDLTTKLDIKLTPVVLQSSQEVTVVAERPLIQRDEVSTRYFISSDQIESQPVDNFKEIAKNQAGVVGNHFRGGRSGEVLVLVDGIPMRDPAGSYSGDLGGFTSEVPEYGIQELEVSLGGFSAEYGNVQSGVLNLALKEGAAKYAGKLRFTSTDFGTPDLNTPLLRDIYEFNLAGPEPLTQHLLPMIGLRLPGNLSFSLSAELTDKNRGYYMNQQSFNQSYQGKLTYRITPTLKLAVGGIFSEAEWDDFYFPASKYGPGPEYSEHEYKYIADSTLVQYQYVYEPAQYRSQQGLIMRNPGTYNGSNYTQVQNYYVAGMQEYLWDRTQGSDIGYVLWTHTLNPTTFYEIRLNNYHTNYHYATRDVEDRDGDGNTKEELQWDINLAGPHPIYREREENYWWIRGDDPGFRDQSSWSRSVKGDVVSQVTPNHLLKGGFEFYLHRTKVQNLSWTLNLSSIRKDIWDEKSIDWGVYLQDKVEFEGIIALVGLRFDAFDPNGAGDGVYFPASYAYPYREFGEADVPLLLDARKPTVKYQLSPRLGISHPITDRDILHFTYGHYFQRPDGYYLYRNHRIQALTKVGNYIGNPNLKPEKTVDYEVGVEHLFSNNIKATVTGYYKDVTNLMNWQKYVGRSIQNIELNVYTNADYGNIKGLEFTIDKRPGRFWGGSINYTFSVAKGRSSDDDAGYGSFTDVRRMNILSYDQTHTINANLLLQTPADFALLSMGGFKPLANWSLVFQIDYGSGLPYSSYGTNKINDQRMPWTSNTDLRIIRQLHTGGLNFDLFFDVLNLFDRKNVDWIGSSRYYEVTGDPSIVMLNLAGEYIRNPQVYSDQRQVRFGLAVQF